MMIEITKEKYWSYFNGNKMNNNESTIIKYIQYAFIIAVFGIFFLIFPLLCIVTLLFGAWLWSLEDD